MMRGMFDVDDLIEACRRANADGEPRRAVREVVERAIAVPGPIGDALQPREGGITLLQQADDLTVLHVVWAPGMVLFPHDHRMWAVIGIYAGQEDNAFFRRSGPQRRFLTESGGKELKVGDTIVLGDDTIHSVSNPLRTLTAAIHVYGGDFVNEPRSQWGPGPREERPFDLDVARQEFAKANEAWTASRS
jgi:predicted metal-dependent enzyme (double-stranded beta helix superfamily)